MNLLILWNFDLNLLMVIANKNSNKESTAKVVEWRDLLDLDFIALLRILWGLSIYNFKVSLAVGASLY